jgi:hypothetical protein
VVLTACVTNQGGYTQTGNGNRSNIVACRIFGRETGFHPRRRYHRAGLWPGAGIFLKTL